MAAATLNGNTVISCTVSIPAWGVWYATVEIDQPAVLSGSVTLVVADLTLKGTIVSGGPWQGRARYRIAGGAGQWGKSIPAFSYANDLGVKKAKIIGDAATACGETIGTAATGTAGANFVRAAGPASRVLEALVPQGWYVDEAGITQIGKRPAVTYAGGAVRMPRDLAASVIELAPTTIADLLPGAVVDGVEAVDVEHVLTDKLRTTVYGRGIAGAKGDPVADNMRAFIDVLTAKFRFFATWEYRVVMKNDEFFDLQCARVSSGMPDLLHVKIRPGVAGIRVHPAPGSLVLVSFINGDQGRPVITAFDDAYSPGFPATEMVLQAGDPGNWPIEHATSAEALVLAVQTTIAAIGAATTAVAGVGSAITALAVDATFASGVLSTIAAGALGPSTKAALLAALGAKSALTTASDKPSLGWPKVRGA